MQARIDTADTRQRIADALAMMEAAHIIDFNGHFSARTGPDRFLINSGASVRSAISAADIIEVDLDGQPLEGDVRPPMEFHIHASIYRRRPEVGAVAHTHPLWSTLFSSVGRKVEPVTMQAALLGEISEFPKTASINTRELGEELADCLGNARVAMLRSHGAVVAAEGVLEVFVLAYYLEETAHRQYLAVPLGTPQVLDAAQREKIRANLWKPHLLQKAWDYHYAKLKR
ncbi:Decarboxylase NovR [Pigmentiphaga humi]|uniref:Decarboxylase NovR n=1 Tax=Pigmentiphaga humi TaxID=2478468 RepID=A0A3P4B5K4_9BURK|nr:class II aldolase/adducin family protein [Pigmentiphaga humi]VCU71589.1 Decarboxylase NovR [Pigmentiphaga humi]